MPELSHDDTETEIGASQAGSWLDHSAPILVRGNFLRRHQYLYFECVEASTCIDWGSSAKFGLGGVEEGPFNFRDCAFAATDSMVSETTERLS